MLKVIKGDLIKMAKEGRFDIICQGCNCFSTMGAGIASLIKKEFPMAYEADKKTLKGDKGKLGSFTGARSGRLMIFNCYTQYYYDSRDGKPLDYDALKNSLTKVVQKYGVSKKIGIPMIGYGLAGGDLIPILNIFYDVLNDYDVKIVIYDKDTKADNIINVINSFISLKDEISKFK